MVEPGERGRVGTAQRMRFGVTWVDIPAGCRLSVSAQVESQVGADSVPYRKRDLQATIRSVFKAVWNRQAWDGVTGAVA